MDGCQGNNFLEICMVLLEFGKKGLFPVYITNSRVLEGSVPHCTVQIAEYLKEPKCLNASVRETFRTTEEIACHSSEFCK